MYSWPIKPGWEPLPHQRETTAFLVQNPKAFCFNEMGTMKTLSALWAADFTMEWEKEHGRECRTLVVAPLSILRVVWDAAIFTHFMGRRSSVVLHGTAEKRRALFAELHDFYIINPDGLTIGVPDSSKSPLTGLAADIAARDDIRIAIIDEASAYRSSQTRRHKAARNLLGHRPYLWLLTGTPTPNGPQDAYGLAKLTGAISESFTVYKNRVMYRPNGERFKWVPREGSERIVHSLLQPAIRFSADFLNLPPCTPEQREVAFSKEQAEAYKALKKFAVHMVESGEMISAVNQAALRMKLIQVAAGAVYGPEKDGVRPSHELNPSPRLSEVRAIIEETERKVIVFAPLTNVLNMLKSQLTEWETEIVNGEAPLARRGDIFRRFGNPRDSLRVLFLDPATVSHGINELVSASVAIWYAPTDKSEHYQQGNKRIHRPGQIGATKIVQLVSTPTEKEIYRRLERQENMQDLVLKLAEEGR